MLLGVSRSPFYYRPKGKSAENLAPMRFHLVAVMAWATRHVLSRRLSNTTGEAPTSTDIVTS